MQSILLEVEARTVVSNGDLKKMRREGWIPAILYGREDKKSRAENVLLKVPEKVLSKAIGAHNTLIELKFGKQTANAVIKEIQRDIISRQLLHVDFLRIVMTENVEVTVQIHIVGEAPGVKLSGGILQHPLRELKILCLPKDIPSEVKVDISKLETGQAIFVKDLANMPGVQILTDSHQLVANVVAPTILEEAPVAAASPTAAEPEVIAKGKKPEEGEEGAAPAKGQEKSDAAASSGKPAPAKGGATASTGKPAK